MTVGTRIRQARLEAGLTQAELAERAGISRSNVAAYEVDKRPLSDDMVERVLSAARRRYPSEILAAHADEVIGIVEKHRGSNVHVFGSCARGDDTLTSDVDLLFEAGPDTGLAVLGAIQAEVEGLLEVEVDLVTFGSLRGASGDRIRAEAVPL